LVIYLNLFFKEMYGEYVDIDQMLEGLTILDQQFCKDHFNVHKINYVIALFLQAVLYNRLKNPRTIFLALCMSLL